MSDLWCESLVYPYGDKANEMSFIVNSRCQLRQTPVPPDPPRSRSPPFPLARCRVARPGEPGEVCACDWFKRCGSRASSHGARVPLAGGAGGRALANGTGNGNPGWERSNPMGKSGIMRFNPLPLHPSLPWQFSQYCAMLWLVQKCNYCWCKNYSVRESQLNALTFRCSCSPDTVMWSCTRSRNVTSHYLIDFFKRNVGSLNGQNNNKRFAIW